MFFQMALRVCLCLQDALTNVSVYSFQVPGLGGVEKAYVHRVIRLLSRINKNYNNHVLP